VDAHVGDDAAARVEVAERMAPLLGWTPARVAEEVDGYRAVVEETRRFR
jgi:hypothetical protein